MADLPVRAISIALIYTGHLWAGIQRRRPYWKAGALCRFAAFFLLGVLALAASLRMARGVDEGVYEGMTRWQHDAYLYTMFALLLGGLAATAGGILWLAYGDAEREFGRRRGRGRRRSDSSAL